MAHSSRAPLTPQDHLVLDVVASRLSICLCSRTCVNRAMDVLREAGFEIRRLDDITTLDALRAVKRFADHAEERQITVPLWAGLIWDEAIGKVNTVLERKEG